MRDFIVQKGRNEQTALISRCSCRRRRRSEGIFLRLTSRLRHCPLYTDATAHHVANYRVENNRYVA